MDTELVLRRKTFTRAQFFKVVLNVNAEEAEMLNAELDAKEAEQKLLIEEIKARVRPKRLHVYIAHGKWIEYRRRYKLKRKLAGK